MTTNKSFKLKDYPQLTKAQASTAKLKGSLFKVKEAIAATQAELARLQDTAIEHLATGDADAYSKTREQMQIAERKLANTGADVTILAGALKMAEESLAPLEQEAKTAWRRELVAARKALNAEGYLLFDAIESYFQQETELARTAQSVGVMLPVLTSRIRMTPDAVRYLKAIFEAFHGGVSND